MIDTQLPFSASRHSPVSLSSSRWASRWSSSQRASATSLFPAKTRRSSGMAKQAPTFPFPPLLHLQRRNENGPLPLGGSSWSSEMDGSSNGEAWRLSPFRTAMAEASGGGGDSVTLFRCVRWQGALRKDLVRLLCIVTQGTD